MYHQVEIGALGDRNAVFIAFVARECQPYLAMRGQWSENIVEHRCSMMLMTARWDGSKGFLGGMVDEGENLLEAALREIKEEANITDLKGVDLLEACSHRIRDGFHSHLYLCYRTYDQLKQIQQNAHTAIHFYSEGAGVTIEHMIPQVKDAFLSGKIFAAKTVREEIEVLIGLDAI